MIILDTHVVIWLYEGLTHKFPKATQKIIDEHDLKISAASFLELQFLYEINRITKDASEITDDLHLRVGLQIADSNLALIAKQAQPLHWTRDPFDRLIVADALLLQCQLITKDRTILENCEQAIWKE
jgi:PIN domain nuclease of toxin-antitoxin system